MTLRTLTYQLFRCFAFRKIKHADMNLITLRMPLVVTAMVSFIFLFLPVQPRIFGSGGINGFVLSFVGALPGFFIASLAAVATFQRSTLDDTLPEPAPTLALRLGAAEEQVQLTMRMFLAHLFSYLCALAIFLAVFCIGSEALAPTMETVAAGTGSSSDTVRMCLRLTYVSITGLLLSNIVITTMFGLYLLAERMHRPIA